MTTRYTPSRHYAHAVLMTLSWPMKGALETGGASLHSARCLGRKQTIQALQKRGLVGTDRRWTVLGWAVAREFLSGKVYTLDEIHEIAQAADC